MRRAIFGRRPRTTLIRSIVILGVALLTFGFVLLPVRLSGISMLPTYRDGAYNVANRLSFLAQQPARGDVVAIRMAGRRVMYIKRIVGMPGERIAIVRGVVHADGQPLSEPYLAGAAPWNLAPFTLAGDEYFVAGDNRRMAIEQHDLGRVTRERIVGKLLF